MKTDIDGWNVIAGWNRVRAFTDEDGQEFPASDQPVAMVVREGKYAAILLQEPVHRASIESLARKLVFAFRLPKDETAKHAPVVAGALHEILPRVVKVTDR